MVKTPHTMLKFRATLGLSLIVLGLVMAASACGGQRPGDWKFGEALALRIPETAVVDQVSYTAPTTVEGERLGTASGTETRFGPTEHVPILSGSETVKVDGVAQQRSTDYTIDPEEGIVTFLKAPESGEVTIDYQREAQFLLRPAQNGTSLYVIRVVVVNSRSNFQSLRVATSSVQLLGEGNLEWQALDPFGETRQEVESPPVDLGKYAPFVWGNFDLPQSYQVDGWLLFEVPEGTKPRTMRWDTGDTILYDL